MSPTSSTPMNDSSPRTSTVTSTNHVMETNNNPNNNNVQVVRIDQTLLRINDEVYVYKIPPALYNGEHCAESWNVAYPLATCSLHVIRRDSSLFLELYASRPKVSGPDGAIESYLFCMSCIQLSSSTSSSSSSNVNNNMEYWIQPVMDSSRYFAIRITNHYNHPKEDESSVIASSSSSSTSTKTTTIVKKREAWIGIGFRERNDAMNFKMSIQEYVHALEKETIAAAMILQQQQQQQHEKEQDFVSLTGDEKNINSMSNNNKNNNIWSLKEGQKIHVQLKGLISSSSSTTTTTTTTTDEESHDTVTTITKLKQSPTVTSSSGMIHKLPLPPPPPPSSSSSSSQSFLSDRNPIRIKTTPSNSIISHMDNDDTRNTSNLVVSNKPIHVNHKTTSNENDDNNDDEEWNDFTSAI